MRDALCESVILLLCLAAAGRANEPPPPLPVGALVLAKRADIQFRIKKQAVEAMPAAVVFTVRQRQGEWLWLGRGWVRESEVVRSCDAIEYFSGEIKQRPTAFAHTSRSIAWVYCGDRSRALIDAEVAVKLDGRYAPARACRANRYLTDGDADTALEALDEAIQLDPRSADFYNYRGRAWLAKKMPDRAVKDFNQAIELSPRMAAAYTNRGRVWMVKGASARALDDARKALKLDARQAMAHVVIGAYWYEQENYDVARTEFDEALRIDPRLMLARFHRGRLYSRLGEYQKALIDLNLAVRLSPKDIASLQQRSYVYYRLGAMEKSNADRLAVRRAQRKTPSPPQTVAQPGASVAAIAAASPTSDEVGLLSNSSESMQPATAWLRAAGTTPSSMQSPPPQDPQPPAQNTKLTQATPLNNVAWRMATSTDERYLNGLRAVELATEACELTEWKRAAFVDTLAAAYAEAGDFEAAVRWQTKAIELSVEKTIRKAAEERLELYREHRPFRTR